MNWPEYIAVDSAVCPWQSLYQGHTHMVSVVLDNLAAGLTPDEIICSYPSLTREAVQATIAYAAELARERVLPLSA